MHKLSYNDICDLRTIKTWMDRNRGVKGDCEVEFSDGVEIMPIRYALFHIFFWSIYVSFNIPIRKDHIYKTDGPFSNDEISGFLTKVYLEISSTVPGCMQELVQCLWFTINHIQNFAAIELPEYQGTLTLRGIAQLMRHPQVQEIISKKIDPTASPAVNEALIKEVSKKLIELLSDRHAVPNNDLLVWFLTKQLNNNQIHQSLFAPGPRTDIDESVVTYSVASPFIDGLANILEYAVEALSARKSAYYNNSAIRRSQYFGRKQHLAASSIRKIYDGDCGSRLTLKFKINKDNYKSIVGKHIVLDDGKVIMLRSSNVKNFIDHEVNMRSPMLCKHRDGTCQACGGGVTSNIDRKLDIGILAASLVVSIITQKILSAKHFVGTVSIMYELPTQLGKYLYTNDNVIFWRKDYISNGKDWYIGININDIGSLSDLQLIAQKSFFQEENYSRMKSLLIKNHKQEVVEYSLMTEGKTPYLSMQMLSYMKKCKDAGTLEISDDCIWIPMKEFPDVPFMKSIIVSDSMLAFVAQVVKFLNDTIDKYTSCSKALEDISKLIFTKATTNIFHIEIVLKAYMISAHDDYRVPVVTDPENVRFSNTPNIIEHRTISGELAYEKLGPYLADPSTYVDNKSAGVFDPMFGWSYQ